MLLPRVALCLPLLVCMGSGTLRAEPPAVNLEISYWTGRWLLEGEVDYSTCAGTSKGAKESFELEVDEDGKGARLRAKGDKSWRRLDVSKISTGNLSLRDGPGFGIDLRIGSAVDAIGRRVAVGKKDCVIVSKLTGRRPSL